MSCQHAEHFDHYDFWDATPGALELCTRQCLACMHHWKVWRPDTEPPIPSQRQVLADVQLWKTQREYAESHGLR